jgi:hypothetical protein
VNPAGLGWRVPDEAESLHLIFVAEKSMCVLPKNPKNQRVASAWF